MHKNHRRKNKGPNNSWWSKFRRTKQYELNQRVRKRRREDKRLIKDEKWDEIRKLEKPVDWWAID